MGPDPLNYTDEEVTAAAPATGTNGKVYGPFERLNPGSGDPVKYLTPAELKRQADLLRPRPAIRRAGAPATIKLPAGYSLQNPADLKPYLAASAPDAALRSSGESLGQKAGEFGTAYAQSFGVPTSRKELEQVGADAAQSVREHPVETVLEGGTPAAEELRKLYQGAKRIGGELGEAGRALETPGVPLSERLGAAASHATSAIPFLGPLKDIALQEYLEAGGEPAYLADPQKYLQNLKIAASPKVLGTTAGAATQAGLLLDGFRAMNDAVRHRLGVLNPEYLPPEARAALPASIEPPTIDAQVVRPPGLPAPEAPTPPATPRALSSGQAALPAPTEGLAPAEAEVEQAILDRIGQHPKADAEVRSDLAEIAPEDRPAVLDAINRQGLEAYQKGDMPGAAAAIHHAWILKGIIDAEARSAAAPVAETAAEVAPPAAEPEAEAVPPPAAPAAEPEPPAAPQPQRPRARRAPVATAEPPAQGALFEAPPEAAAPIVPRGTTAPPVEEVPAETPFDANEGTRTGVTDLAAAPEAAAPPEAAPPTPAAEAEPGLVGQVAEKIGKKKRGKATKAATAVQAASAAPAPPQDEASQRVAATIGKWLKRAAMEQQGHNMLDEMEANNESVKAISDKFWNDTYYKLPAEVQQRFQRYVSELWGGLKPGDVISTGPRGEIRAKDWMDLAQNMDLADEPQYLEGAERGYAVLMREANRRFAEGAPQPPATPAAPAKRAARKRELPPEQEVVGPYEVLGAQDTHQKAEHYAGGPAEIWRVRTDAGDMNVYVTPGGGRAEAVQEANKLMSQNLAAGVPPERIFNPGTYTGAPTAPPAPASAAPAPPAAAAAPAPTAEPVKFKRVGNTWQVPGTDYSVRLGPDGYIISHGDQYVGRASSLDDVQGEIEQHRSPAAAQPPAAPAGKGSASEIKKSHAEARARTREENAAKATAVQSTRNNAPVIAVNDDAMVLLDRLAGVEERTNAKAMNAPQADKIIADLRELAALDPQHRQGLAQLADLMQSHRTPNGNVILHRSIMSEDELNGVMLEELFHDWQMKYAKPGKALQLDGAMLLGPSADAWKQASWHLIKEYGYSPLVAGLEAPAWVASGAYPLLGINSEQATNLLADYFERAKRILGDKAVAQLPPMDKALERTVGDEIRRRNLGEPGKDVAGGRGGRVDTLEPAQQALPDKTATGRGKRKRAASREELVEAQNAQPSWLVRGVQKYAERRGSPFHVAPEGTRDARAMEIADAYSAMKHEPDNPEVKASYDALKRDLAKQWDHAKEMGVNFEPWTQEGQPYVDSAAMRADVENNHHLYFFLGGDMPADHPLAQIDPATGYTYNDMLRAVHDLYGHAVYGHQFGAKGEENAWIAHAQMFSREALPALTTETKGQNNWVNFGPYMRRPDGTLMEKGDPGWLPAYQRPFAEQKAGLLPTRYHYRIDAPLSFISPNVLNLPSVTEAQKQLKSDIHRRFVDEARRLADDMSLNVVIESALGSWQGGAENSLAAHYPFGTDPDLVKYYEATLGRLGYQFATARFTPDSKGNDTIHYLWASLDKDPSEIAQLLLNNGIKNSTIIPARDGYGITIIDGGDELHDNIRKAINELGVKSVGNNRGTAEFPGSYTDRDEAERGFLGTNQEIESRRPSLRGVRRRFESRPGYLLLHKAIRDAEALGSPPAEFQSRQRKPSLDELKEEAEQRKAESYDLKPDIDPEQVAANRKNNLTWDDLQEFLLPVERKGYADKPELQRKLVAAVNMMPNVDEWDAAVKAGMVGRLWYERSARAFDALIHTMPESFHSKDKNKFLNFVSALSPVQTVRLNLMMAIDLWDKWNKAGRPTDVEWKNPKTFTGVANENSKLYRLMAGLEKEEVPPEERGLFGGGRKRKVLRKVRGVDLESRLYNAIRALQGQPLSGPKVSAFAPNLGKDVDKSTNDTWMAVFADTDPNVINQKHLYDAVSAHVRIAAEKNGIPTRQAQAAIWSFIKSLAEMSGWGAGRWIPPQEIIDRGLLTPDSVEAHSQDFADLMLHDYGIRAKLSKIGADLNALDEKLGRIVPGKPEADPRAIKRLAGRLSGAAGRLEAARESERTDRHLARKLDAVQGRLLIPQSAPEGPPTLGELKAEAARLRSLF